MCTVCLTYSGRQIIEIAPKKSKAEAAEAKTEKIAEKKPEGKPKAEEVKKS